MANFYELNNGTNDSQSMGIRRVFRILQERYFPMPDYDFQTDSSSDNQQRSAWILVK